MKNDSMLTPFIKKIDKIFFGIDDLDDVETLQETQELEDEEEFEEDRS